MPFKCLRRFMIKDGEWLSMDRLPVRLWGGSWEYPAAQLISFTRENSHESGRIRQSQQVVRSGCHA